MKLFVAAMGASNYTYAEACPSESLSDWKGVHANLFIFLGGVPKFVICAISRPPVKAKIPSSSLAPYTQMTPSSGSRPRVSSWMSASLTPRSLATRSTV